MQRYSLVIVDDYDSKGSVTYKSDTPFGSFAIGDTLTAQTVGDSDQSHVYRVKDIRHNVVLKSNTEKEMSHHEIRLLIEKANEV